MAIIVSHSAKSGRAGSIQSLTNRPNAGGVKKAGIMSGSVGWSVGNMGTHVYNRAPQTQPSLSFALLNTTRHAVQGSNYRVSRKPM